jgi:hypothetical protein
MKKIFILTTLLFLLSCTTGRHYYFYPIQGLAQPTGQLGVYQIEGSTIITEYKGVVEISTTKAELFLSSDTKGAEFKVLSDTLTPVSEGKSERAITQYRGKKSLIFFDGKNLFLAIIRDAEAAYTGPGISIMELKHLPKGSYGVIKAELEEGIRDTKKWYGKGE